MVTMTETAAKKVSELRLEEGKPEWGLRIRVVGGGCSGPGLDGSRTIRESEYSTSPVGRMPVNATVT